MQTYFIAILLAAVAIGSSTANPNLIPGPTKMFEIMSATSEVQRNNPALATACFNYYQVSYASDYALYQEEYNACTHQFEAGRSGVLEKYNRNVWDLSNATYDSCKALINCDDQADSLDSLKCYSAQGTTNSEQAFTISSNASIAVGNLEKEITVMNLTQIQCYDDSSRNYTIRSQKTSAQLDDCLKGKSDVPEPPTTTRTSPTTSESTTPTVESTTTTRTPPTTSESTTPISVPTASSTTDRTSSSGVTAEPTTVSPFLHGEPSSEEKKQWMSKLDNILRHLH